MRLRITFAKTDAMRFTGHRDLHRTWERIIRRANLPLAYSQGFSPHPRLNLASALPLGFVGDNEVIDIWLEERIILNVISERLQSASPPGIKILNVAEIEANQPALQMMLLASEYHITFLEHNPELDFQISRVQSATKLNRKRRNKDYDLRPLILDIVQLPADDQGLQQIVVLLKTQESATGRPEELLDELGSQPEDTYIRRLHLIFESTP